ncbi:MAG TPA: hypothetical protein VGC62_03240 [Pseudomonas sp.]|uniref:hypothetical protein n=1 Tax=Pseudomonas sp. TaxID=306 RepID=UPI002EDAA7CB
MWNKSQGWAPIIAAGNGVRQTLQGRRRKWLLLLAILAVFGLVRLCIDAFADDPEIALIIGEPWEGMRVHPNTQNT